MRDSRFFARIVRIRSFWRSIMILRTYNDFWFPDEMIFLRIFPEFLERFDFEHGKFFLSAYPTSLSLFSQRIQFLTRGSTSFFHPTTASLSHKMVLVKSIWSFVSMRSLFQLYSSSNAMAVLAENKPDTFNIAHQKNVVQYEDLSRNPYFASLFASPSVESSFLHMDDGAAYATAKVGFGLDASRTGYVLYELLGWGIVFFWSIALTGQPLLNFLRRSTNGVSHIFQAHALAGFSCYLLFTVYTSRHVSIHDRIFAGLSVFCTCIVWLQVWLYRNKEQSSSARLNNGEGADDHVLGDESRGRELGAGGQDTFVTQSLGSEDDSSLCQSSRSAGTTPRGEKELRRRVAKEDPDPMFSDDVQRRSRTLDRDLPHMLVATIFLFGATR